MVLWFLSRGNNSTKNCHCCHCSLNCATCLADAAYCCLCVSCNCDPLLPSVLLVDCCLFFPFICCICNHHLLHCTVVWSMSMQPTLLILVTLSSHLVVLCRHITNVEVTVAASWLLLFAFLASVICQCQGTAYCTKPWYCQTSTAASCFSPHWFVQCPLKVLCCCTANVDATSHFSSWYLPRPHCLLLHFSVTNADISYLVSLCFSSCHLLLHLSPLTGLHAMTPMLMPYPPSLPVDCCSSQLSRTVVAVTTCCSAPCCYQCLCCTCSPAPMLWYLHWWQDLNQNNNTNDVSALMKWFKTK